MSNAATNRFPSHKSLDLLSRLLLAPRSENASPKVSALDRDLLSLTRAEFEDALTLADLNHVVIRGMSRYLRIAREANDTERAEWAQAALDTEQFRIRVAVEFLEAICAAFAAEGLDAMVIKSLDHWPDLGSDLDLYTPADAADVARLMQRSFNGRIAERSWGDRLACKWNFIVPGLPESVEIHAGRLGQTGEQISIASSLVARSRTIEAGGRAFRVPSKSDRLTISTLQRMYRHFYFRLCDIVDSAALVEQEGVDFEDLRTVARKADIWEGVATYLTIVSDYVKSFRGTGIELPEAVTRSARFGGEAVYYGRGFIRIPILPQSAKLYGSQLAGVLRRRELHAGARLSLLPWLATAAVVGMKITGSDKGIW